MPCSLPLPHPVTQTSLMHDALFYLMLLHSLCLLLYSSLLLSPMSELSPNKGRCFSPTSGLTTLTVLVSIYLYVIISMLWKTWVENEKPIWKSKTFIFSTHLSRKHGMWRRSNHVGYENGTPVSPRLPVMQCRSLTNIKLQYKTPQAISGRCTQSGTKEALNKYLSSVMSHFFTKFIHQIIDLKFQTIFLGSALVQKI